MEESKDMVFGLWAGWKEGCSSVKIRGKIMPGKKKWIANPTARSHSHIQGPGQRLKCLQHWEIEGGWRNRPPPKSFYLLVSVIGRHYSVLIRREKWSDLYLRRPNWVTYKVQGCWTFPDLDFLFAGSHLSFFFVSSLILI